MEHQEGGVHDPWPVEEVLVSRNEDHTYTAGSAWLLVNLTARRFEELPIFQSRFGIDDGELGGHGVTLPFFATLFSVYRHV